MMLTNPTMNMKDIPNKDLKAAAKTLGVSWWTLYQIKRGHRNPSKSMAESIEAVLGVPKERVMWPDSECCPCDRDQAANEP